MFHIHLTCPWTEDDLLQYFNILYMKKFVYIEQSDLLASTTSGCMVKHFGLLNLGYSMCIIYTQLKAVRMVKDRGTHHGLILISGIGKQVKKTVPRRKGFLPHTSDRAPMSGALRKESRPWRRTQKQGLNLEFDLPITCNF